MGGESKFEVLLESSYTIITAAASAKDEKGGQVRGGIGKFPYYYYCNCFGER
jgi:hypothetical protein